MLITMQSTRLAWPAKTKTENDSRLLKKSEGNYDDEWTFCRGQKTRIRMIRKIFEEN